MTKWKQIWNRRRVDDAGGIFETLLKADGYDSAFGTMKVDAFMGFVDTVERMLAIQLSDSVFEVGCGAGAVLYPFYVRGHKVGGIDYSEPLVAKAAELMPDMEFAADEAIRVNPDAPFDLVLSCGAFIYFESFDYAEAVLCRMLQKAIRAVGIFDVSDLALKPEAEKFRQNGMGAEAYAVAYDGLPHRYYPKSFFEDMASAAGCRLRIFPQAIDGYRNSPFRYNVIMWK